MGEVFANHISNKGFISKICKELTTRWQKTSIKKWEALPAKMNKLSEQTFFQRKYTDGQQVHRFAFP